MPSLTRLLATAASILLVASTANAQIPMGSPCTAPADVNACDGTRFMICDNGRWTFQNFCPVDCTQSPAHAASCFNNSQGGASPSSSSSAPPSPSNTNTPAPPTGNKNSTSSVPPSSGNPTPAPGASNPPGTSDPSSSSGSKKSNAGAIAGGVVGGLAALALVGGSLFFVQRRKSVASQPTPATATAATLGASGKRQEEGMAINQAGPSSAFSAANLNVASVLEKKYIVRHDYQAAAEDEINLRVGDKIRLDLLFNDGWAKGTNETTGQQGLLPVACLQEA